MTDVPLTSLVIDSRKLLRIKMDGPALNVVMRGKSPVLFPLRRLLRVHILGTPVSGMYALMCCAEQNIPIVFFNFNGRLRCRLVPSGGTPSLMDHWLEHVQFDAEVSRLYNDWLLNQKLHIFSSLGMTGGTCEFRYQLAYETLRGYCRKQLGKKKMKMAVEWLDGLLSVHLEQVIGDFGFVQESGKHKLLNDTKPAFDMYLLYFLSGHLQKDSGFNVGARSMTAFYQKYSIQVESSVRRMLIQLENQLEAVV